MGARACVRPADRPQSGLGTRRTTRSARAALGGPAQTDAIHDRSRRSRSGVRRFLSRSALWYPTAFSPHHRTSIAPGSEKVGDGYKQPPRTGRIVSPRVGMTAQVRTARNRRDMRPALGARSSEERYDAQHHEARAFRSPRPIAWEIISRAYKSSAPGRTRSPRVPRSVREAASWLVLAACPRPATNREQRGAALRTVALPTGPTVGQGYLTRVRDRDLLAADASTLGTGILYR